MNPLRRNCCMLISVRRAANVSRLGLGREQIAGALEMISVWALGGLLLTLPFWRHRVLLHRPVEEVFFEFHDIIFYTNDLLWYGALAAWLLSRLVHRRVHRLRLGPPFLYVPLLGFLALATLGSPTAVDPPFAVYQTVRLILLLALYLLLVNLPIRPGAIAWPLAAGLGLQAIVAVPQFVLGKTLGLRRLGEVAEYAARDGASVVMVGQESWLRAYGFAQHPNLLAGCLMVMLLIVAGHYLSLRGWRRLPALAELGSGCVALLLTFSRAAWLGTLLGGSVVLVFQRRTRGQPAGTPDRSTVALLGVVLVGVSLTFVGMNGPLLGARFWMTTQATEIESVEARMDQVPAAQALIRAHPALGVGIGNYASALHALVAESGAHRGDYQPVFNVPLLVTAELGVMGGVLWLWLIAAPWPALWRRCRRAPLDPWWAGVSGALLALIVVSFFDFYVWTSHQGQLALWVVMGLWGREWGGGATDDRRTTKDERRLEHEGAKRAKNACGEARRTRRAALRAAQVGVGCEDEAANASGNAVLGTPASQPAPCLAEAASAVATRVAPSTNACGCWLFWGAAKGRKIIAEGRV